MSVNRYFFRPKPWMAAVLAPFLWQCAFAQGTESKETQTREAKGLPARATPGDYQTHGQAGTIKIGAEFDGHSVPTEDAVLSTEDYVVVEIGLFGPAGARLKLSFEDFSLRIDGKKVLIPAQPYGIIFSSLKDPDWSPPKPAGEAKSNTKFGSPSGEDGSTPAPAHMPIELVRAMQQRVQKAALPEGDRALPEAGLLFFPHHGKTENLRSIELIYAGPAGKATIALQ